ncbi:MAG: DUF11 domain-containing protein [Acidobacteria bacterium]|nr:DUF11 domain-containing protein [Acidobacteriota bacterium]MBV9477675.1 DUF11 domain-containing protein [Acidobacteriota bacterium]
MNTYRRLLLLAAALLLAPLLAAQEADLLVTKTGPDQATAGSNVSYDVVVTNLGADDAAFVTLDDPLPAGMTFVSATQTDGTPFSCSTPSVGDTTGSVNCTAALLAAGDFAEFTIVYAIPAGTPDSTSFVNIATASSETFDPNDENNSGVATTSTPPSPTSDMAVTKNGPSSAGPNTNVVYTIGITNNGPAPATTVQLTDQTSGLLEFVSFTQDSGPTLSCSTPAAGSTGGTITCTIASFPAGSSATFTLTEHVPADTPSGTSAENNVAVSADNDSNSENDTAATTLTVSAVDVGVVKSGPATANAGEDVPYTIVLSNSGADTATNAGFTDTLPAGTTFVSLVQNTGTPANCAAPAVGTNGTAGCTLSLLGSGQSATFTLTLNTGGTTGYTNTANAFTDSFDTNPANDSSSVTTAVTPIADVAVTKNGPTGAQNGDTITYNVGVTNNGPSAAANVSLTDTLPAGTTFVSETQTSGPTFSCTTPAVGASGTITCTIASLAAGATATFDFSFTLTPTTTGAVSNTANVSSTTSDPNPANNTATASTDVTLGPTDLSITKTASSNRYPVGADATYTITVTNNGPGYAVGTTVTDVLPAGTTYVSATPSQGSCSGTSVVTCTLGTLAPSATATISLVVTLPSTQMEITNTATVTASNVDPNPANNASTAAAATVSQVPALSPLGLVLLALSLVGAAWFVQRR